MSSSPGAVRRRLFGEPDEYHRDRLEELPAAPRLPLVPGERWVERGSTGAFGLAEPKAQRKTGD